ncbi:hypothetical protein QBA75_06360 [Streptomyces stelliscabiei]
MSSLAVITVLVVLVVASRTWAKSARTQMQRTFLAFCLAVSRDICTEQVRRAGA